MLCGELTVGLLTNFANCLVLTCSCAAYVLCGEFAVGLITNCTYSLIFTSSCAACVSCKLTVGLLATVADCLLFTSSCAAYVLCSVDFAVFLTTEVANCLCCASCLAACMTCCTSHCARRSQESVCACCKLTVCEVGLVSSYMTPLVIRESTDSVVSGSKIVKPELIAMILEVFFYVRITLKVCHEIVHFEAVGVNYFNLNVCICSSGNPVVSTTGNHSALEVNSVNCPVRMTLLEVFGSFHENAGAGKHALFLAYCVCGKYTERVLGSCSTIETVLNEYCLTGRNVLRGDSCCCGLTVLACYLNVYSALIINQGLYCTVGCYSRCNVCKVYFVCKLCAVSYSVSTCASVCVYCCCLTLCCLLGDCVVFSVFAEVLGLNCCCSTNRALSSCGITVCATCSNNCGDLYVGIMCCEFAVGLCAKITYSLCCTCSCTANVLCRELTVLLTTLGAGCLLDTCSCATLVVASHEFEYAQEGIVVGNVNRSNCCVALVASCTECVILFVNYCNKSILLAVDSIYCRCCCLVCTVYVCSTYNHVNVGFNTVNVAEEVVATLGLFEVHCKSIINFS